MGNETSSVKIHSLLTADDIKRLRAGFPVSIASKLYFTVLIEMAGPTKLSNFIRLSVGFIFRMKELVYSHLRTCSGVLGRQPGIQDCENDWKNS